MENTRYEMHTYKHWLESLLDPAEWLAATRDYNGNPVWFTAAQFMRYLPECEERGILRAHYAINRSEQYVDVSFYHEEVHAAAVCRWYHLSTLENVEIDISEGTTTTEYAARVAMVVEAGSLDTTNDYRTLKLYCQNHLLSHHSQLRKNSPIWDDGEFLYIWVNAYKDAAVKRMRVMATNRMEAINDFIVTPNLGTIEK